MRYLAILSLIVVAACAKKEENANPPADSASTAVVAPTPLTLADWKGAWKVDAKRADNDSTLVGYTLWASDDTAQWKLKFDPRNDTIKVHVLAFGGDSVALHVGPYLSAVRKNVEVQTEMKLHMLNGSVSGTGVAHYKVPTADSVTNLKFTGARAN